MYIFQIKGFYFFILLMFTDIIINILITRLEGKLSMNLSKIGHTIKTLRNELEITQSQLSEGICTQGLISKIENGTVIPSIDVIYKICSKLGVSLDLFLQIHENKNYCYWNEVFNEVKKLIREQKFREAMETIKAEKRNLHYLDNEGKQFFLWSEGICLYYLERNLDKTIEYLKRALEVTNVYTEKEIEILNSMAIIYCEESMDDYAYLILKYAIENLKTVKVSSNYKIEVRLFYNMAKVLNIKGCYNDSISYCNEGIKRCNMEESIYLLGKIYYYRGVNHLLLNIKENAIKDLEEAYTISKLKKDYTLINLIKKTMDKLEL